MVGPRLLVVCGRSGRGSAGCESLGDGSVAGGSICTRAFDTHHARGIASVAILAGGSRVACAGHDLALSVWCVRSESCVAALDYRSAIGAMPWFVAPWQFEKEPFKLCGGGEGGGEVGGEGGGEGGGGAGGGGAAPWEADEEDAAAVKEAADELAAKVSAVDLAAGAAAEAAAAEAASGAAVDVTDSPAQAQGLAGMHELLQIEASGESMLVTGDRAGCVCIWDASEQAAGGGLAGAAGGEAGVAGAAGAGGAAPSAATVASAALGAARPQLKLVAVLPPPDYDGPTTDACAIRGLAVTDTGAAAVAGNGVVYSNVKGELTKFIPMGHSSLASLSEGGLREELFQGSLFDGLHKGL